jgi:hypothetical protein
MNDESRPKAAPETATKQSEISVSRQSVYEDEAREAAFRRHQHWQQRCPVTTEELSYLRRRRPKYPPRIEVLISTRWTAEIRGSHVVPVLNKAGCPRQYQYQPPSGGDATWIVPQQHVADVIAAAEIMNGSAQVVNELTLWCEAS